LRVANLRGLRIGEWGIRLDIQLLLDTEVSRLKVILEGLGIEAHLLDRSFLRVDEAGEAPEFDILDRKVGCDPLTSELSIGHEKVGGLKVLDPRTGHRCIFIDRERRHLRVHRGTEGIECCRFIRLGLGRLREDILRHHLFIRSMRDLLGTHLELKSDVSLS
jgi:hypothetical protein